MHAGQTPRSLTSRVATCSGRPVSRHGTVRGKPLSIAPRITRAAPHCRAGNATRKDRGKRQSSDADVMSGWNTSRNNQQERTRRDSSGWESSAVDSRGTSAIESAFGFYADAVLLSPLRIAELRQLVVVVSDCDWRGGGQRLRHARRTELVQRLFSPWLKRRFCFCPLRYWLLG